MALGGVYRWGFGSRSGLDQGERKVVTRHYSQALHPDGKLWRVLYELRWVPRLALVGALVWMGAMALDREPPFTLLSYWTNQHRAGGTCKCRSRSTSRLGLRC